MSTSACAVCGEDAPHLCARCYSVGYCGRDHQKQHWKAHLPACRIMALSPKCAVCKRPPSLRCDRCESTWYCGEEHQKKDQQKHKKTACIAYKVVAFPGQGSQVVAIRDIKEGEIIVNEDPLLFGPDHLTTVSCCIGCLQVLPLSDRCPRCHWSVCSLSCPGLKHPLFHGAECAFMIDARRWIIMNPQIIVPLRMLLLQINDRKKWETIREMCLTAIPKLHKELSKSKMTRALFENIVIKPAIKHLLGYGMSYSADTVEQIFSFLDTYALEAKLPYSSYLVGAGAVISSMEHSCLPNTKRIFDVPEPDAKGVPFQCRIIVKAARNIKKGEHLTTWFVRNLMCTWNRQQSLVINRGMYCACDRCLDPRELGTNFNTLKCKKCSGDVLPVDPHIILESKWRCVGSCDATVPPEYLPELFGRTMRETDNLQTEEFCHIKMEKALEELQKLFHTNHYFCVKLKTRMFNVYGTNSHYEDVLNACMAELGLSALGKAVNPGLARMSVAELERKAELCREVLAVIDNPNFLCSDGELDECLTQLSLSLTEIANRKAASKEWSAKRVSEALEESRVIMERAVKIKLHSHNPADAASPK